MVCCQKFAAAGSGSALDSKYILFHNSKDSFRVSLNISVLQPLPDPSVPVSLVGPILTFLDLPCQCGVLLRLSLLLHKVIVTTPGHTEKLTHDRYRVFVPVTIDYRILYLWPHFLSVDCRKSRSSLFSIRRRSTSFCRSCLGTCPSLRGRPLGRGTFPDASLRSLRR